MDKWIKGLYYIHIMKNYSAIKSNKLLIHTTTWMDFRNRFTGKKGTHILPNNKQKPRLSNFMYMSLERANLIYKETKASWAEANRL